MRKLVAAAAALLLGLSTNGCGGDDESVSATCDSAMRAAAAETDSRQANPLIIRTLSACGSADEWLAALEDHPAAIGLTERAKIDDVALESACPNQDAKPVCADAIEDGRISATD
jgi:hypothetical protein